MPWGCPAPVGLLDWQTVPVPSYIAFLRAVNIGKRQVRMEQLRTWLEDDGFTDVETYIQTGNVRVSTRMRSKAKVEQRLEELLQEGAGFASSCIVPPPAELTGVHADAMELKSPFPEADEQRRYVVFFKDPIEA